MDKLQLRSKWLQTNKNERLKSLTKNIKKLRSSRHICSINSLPWKFPQKCLSTETGRITKYRPHHAASFLWFFENCKISTPQGDEKSLMETESLKEKISCDLGFSLPYMNVNLKQLSVEFLSVKVFMSLKSHLLPKSTVTFVYLWHIKNWSFLFDSKKSMQQCFCQQWY